MAGKVPVTATAHRAFVDNLRRGADKAQGKGVTLLIEPINMRSAPGYFLTGSQQAIDIIAEVDRPNVNVMARTAYSLKTPGTPPPPPPVPARRK